MSRMRGLGYKQSAALTAALCLAALLSSCGPKPSPVQSSLRRFDFPLVGLVQESGSDWASERFNKTLLPKLIVKGAQEFTAAALEQNLNQIALDPNKLVMAEGGKVRLYYVSESSGFRNILGINFEGIGIKSGKPMYIFPNASSNLDLYQAAQHVNVEENTFDVSAMGERSEEAPLMPGDFVDLGHLPAGTPLNFFLINEDPNVFTTHPEANPDGIVHVVAVAIEDSPYLLISFEDLLNGGDKDYSDCVFMVEVGEGNIQALIGKIDPLRQAKRIAAIVGFLMVFVGGPLGFLYMRRRIRLARLAADLNRAGELLTSSQPEAALPLIRARKKLAGRTRSAEWEDLEITCLNQLGAVGDLTELYKESPDAFTRHETPSLDVARAAIETDRFDLFQTMRESWRERETAPQDWLALDADVLMRQDKSEDAREILEAARFEGAADARRLIRLALATAHDDPAAAHAALARAEALGAQAWEVRLFQGRIAQAHGDAPRAEAAYKAALTANPRDLFIRDALAELLRTEGRFAEAVHVWSQGLTAPSMGFVWTKTLFWCRVAAPAPVDWQTLDPPQDTLRPLVQFVRALPPTCFWNERAFGPVAEARPDLASRQEVFWLRLLEALRTRKTDEALALLNLNRFGRHSWHARLEVALLSLLTYHRLGFVDPALVKLSEGSGTKPHPFFDTLEAWASGSAVPPEFVRLMQSNDAFAAALKAAGWIAAVGLLSEYSGARASDSQ
ncbi:MAG: DUF4114 domain-containing protein [Candidatus Hydrogenedentes bacterium]|nr:DUF4114 domain-containing protein [Candidatus Hydrogenedentota bacterium]